MPLQTIHRPTNFDDFFGNESQIESLQSVLNREKDKPHCYLFTGPAGIGKSSLGLMLKDILNCSDSDFYLYNTANTRGIDTIRAIDDSCRFAPMSGNIKLYIMEEIHGLTGPSLESLLVLLENPPKHVYFVFCTTEPEKLKPTFKRRCHTTALSSLPNPKITKLLAHILKKEGVQDFPKEVIKKIVATSNGSPGIALGLLDTVIDIENDDAALAAINDATVAEANITEIARLLLDGNAQWKSIAKLIKGLKGEPESLRHAFLSWFNTVLLDRGDIKTATIMSNFVDSIMYAGISGLTIIIHSAWGDSLSDDPPF